VASFSSVASASFSSVADTNRSLDGWNDLTDSMKPPAGSLHTFVRLHAEVGCDHLASLWEAFLQWVRVYGRFEERRYSPLRTPTPWPCPRLCQPSLAVDDLWQLLAGDADAWRELPEHVRFMARVPVRVPPSRLNLDETYVNAYLDDYGSLRLPLLFRIDEILGLDGARLYRGECISDDCLESSEAGLDPEPGRTCLHHIPWFPIS
jgi:hypothetical protein